MTLTSFTSELEADFSPQRFSLSPALVSGSTSPSAHTPPYPPAGPRVLCPPWLRSLSSDLGVLFVSVWFSLWRSLVFFLSQVPTDSCFPQTQETRHMYSHYNKTGKKNFFKWLFSNTWEKCQFQLYLLNLFSLSNISSLKLFLVQ